MRRGRTIMKRRRNKEKMITMRRITHNKGKKIDCDKEERQGEDDTNKEKILK